GGASAGEPVPRHMRAGLPRSLAPRPRSRKNSLPRCPDRDYSSTRMVSPSIERVSAVGGGCAAFVFASLLAAGPAAAAEWPMYAGGPPRPFFHPAETPLPAANPPPPPLHPAFPAPAL